MPSAASIGRVCGAAALFCAVVSIAGAFTTGFAVFWLLGLAAMPLGLGGIVFGLAGLVASRGERVAGAFGLVAGVVGLGLPTFLVLAILAGLSNME